MSERDDDTAKAAKQKSLADLDARLKKARETAPKGWQAAGRMANGPATGVGLAWRVSIELIVAVGLCAAVGWGLDQWFGTTPWLLVAFVFLGFGVGIRNVYGLASRGIGGADDDNDKDGEAGR